MNGIGSCQFPTLGFIVDRYMRVQNFKPEEFWSISVLHNRDDINVKFLWDRNHLFDRAIVTILFERCLLARHATITKLETKPTSKWKPLPLTTVELQKLGSMFLRIDSSRVMSVAEDLYTRGLISYPRTETDQFDQGMDLRAIIQKQTNDARWGRYAQGLLDGNFRQPRAGRHNDQAHPPIHPVNYSEPHALNNDDERKIYEFIVRRFLGACSEDAKGSTTTVRIQYGPESFHAVGLIVLERNYLEVYTYDRWQSSQQLPNFREGERFEPNEANIVSGKTSPPNYLTEPELIALMDANGIGTDATMAEHIQKVQVRNYTYTQMRGSIKEFIPSTMGVALIEGYEKLGLTTSLGKPFLRKEMELKMKAICEGRATRREVVQEMIDQYRDIYVLTAQRVDVLMGHVKRMCVDQPQLPAPPQDLVDDDGPGNGRTTSRPARATTRGTRGGPRGRGSTRTTRGSSRGRTRASRSRRRD
jgi:DNA topoisomerase-3